MALDWQCVERHRVRSDIAAKEVEAIGYSKPMRVIGYFLLTDA